MAVWDELQEGYEAGFDARREVFGEDVCDLVEPGLTEDAEGTGNTLDNDPDPLAANVACIVKEISGGAAQVVVDGVTVVATHAIEMKRSPEALALTPHGYIRLHARSPKPQMIFEQPVRAEATFTPLTQFKAILVKEGYRQPAIT